MTLAYHLDPTGILIGLLMAIPLLGFLGVVTYATQAILKERRACESRKEVAAFRKGFRSALDWMDGLTELPQEITTWPDALKEVDKHDY